MVTCTSAYLCVLDMDRAIHFYETLLQQPVTQRDEVYSVFDLNGFRLGLFAYETQQEYHVFGNNCLLSLEVASIEQLTKLMQTYEVVFPLTLINDNWVGEIKDSEGNCLELTTANRSSS